MMGHGRSKRGRMDKGSRTYRLISVVVVVVVVVATLSLVDTTSGSVSTLVDVDYFVESHIKRGGHCCIVCVV
jgi:hypothetical protein